MKAGFVLVALVATASALGCRASMPVTATTFPGLADLRGAARASNDAELVGRWALSEELSPGGTAEEALAARRRLDAPTVTGRGTWAALARAVVDEAHGDPRSAATAFVDVLHACESDPQPDAPLVAWFAARQLLSLRGSVAGLFTAHRSEIDSLLAHPGHVGWRAVAELEDWRAMEVYAIAERAPGDYDAEVVQRMGCARAVRMAGPFGHGSAADTTRSFDAEKPGPWPPAWPADAMRGTTPHVLPLNQTRCLVQADEQVQEGVFYVESFFKTRGERELIVAVQGAVSLWVDGDPRALAQSPGVGFVAALRRSSFGVRRTSPHRGQDDHARDECPDPRAGRDRRRRGDRRRRFAADHRRPAARPLRSQPDRGVRADGARRRSGCARPQTPSRRLSPPTPPTSTRWTTWPRRCSDRSRTPRTRRRSRSRWPRHSCRAIRRSPRTPGHPARARCAAALSLATRPSGAPA